MVIVQIEDPEPMAELEAIAQVPGIDMLFFGPGDFSQGIGHTGEMGNPQIIEARRQIAQTAARYGKFAGTVGRSTRWRRRSPWATSSSTSPWTCWDWSTISVGQRRR